MITMFSPEERRGQLYVMQCWRIWRQ